MGLRSNAESRTTWNSRIARWTGPLIATELGDVRFGA
jgi:hypothetical protein